MARKNRVPAKDATWEEMQDFDEREKRLALIRAEEHQKRLTDAYIAVAKTEEGRRVLSEIVNSEYTEAPFMAFAGNSRDAFNMGRGMLSIKMKRMLREILDRQTFISIIEPEKEEE